MMMFCLTKRSDYRRLVIFGLVREFIYLKLMMIRKFLYMYDSSTSCLLTCIYSFLSGRHRTFLLLMSGNQIYGIVQYRINPLLFIYIYIYKGHTQKNSSDYICIYLFVRTIVYQKCFLFFFFYSKNKAFIPNFNGRWYRSYIFFQFGKHTHFKVD